jgi:glucokinase
MTLAVGVDLGGTNLRAALVDVETGALLAEDKYRPTDRAPAAIADAVEQAVRRVDPDGRRRGVGIGIAAMLRGWTGIVVNAPNLGWREVAFRALVEGRLPGERIELFNDLNAIALGEQRYGAGRGSQHVLCVYIGTGIGAGLVLDGRLYIGATHLAGEIGHAKVVLEGGRACGCGAHGCLEAYASGKNIAARAHEELVTRSSAAVGLAGSVEAVHAGHLDEAARGGDAYALSLWDEVSRHAGLALGAAITLLNPERLVLGGGVLSGAPLLAERVHARLRQAANAASLEGFSIVDTALGDHAGVLGAAAGVVDLAEAGPARGAAR